MGIEGKGRDNKEAKGHRGIEIGLKEGQQQRQ